jgi:hypothetical protein
MNAWSPVELVPPEALAEKLYADNVRRDMLEDDVETKLFFDYEEYHDAEPPAKEKRRLADYVQYETNMLKHMVIGLAGAGEMELSYKIATRHGEAPDGRYKMSFRPFFSGIGVPFTSIPRVLDAAYENQPREHIPWDMSVYSRRRLLACVNGQKHAADARLLTMERPDDDVRDYVAQLEDEDWIFAARRAPAGREQPAAAARGELRGRRRAAAAHQAVGRPGPVAAHGARARRRVRALGGWA